MTGYLFHGTRRTVAGHVLRLRASGHRGFTVVASALNDGERHRHREVAA